MLRHRLILISRRSTAFRTRVMSQSTIAVLDASELVDGQMKQVAFGDGKVLLSKLGDQVYATSAFCTHYGAPLEKGVLTADGTLRCPWHGACFNVFTGDIEDAPAPSALHCFQTDIKDGKIFVTASPEDTKKENMSRPGKILNNIKDGSTRQGTVIIGGGSGAFFAVGSLRENGYTSPITILTKESHTPIDRTKLSKALITDSSKLALVSASDLKIKHGTTIRTRTTVTFVNTKDKTVTIQEGNETIPYENLIISTGGIPRRLPIPGSEAENVCVLRSVEDTAKIDQYAKEGAKVVVIGSSFIGMEVVAAMASRKLAKIHVIGMESVPFQNVLGKDVGGALQKFHESKGVEFHMQAKVKGITTTTPEEGTSLKATAVDIEGATLEADFVLMAVGVAPATSFLKDTGIELQKDGGIKTDEYLRVPGADGVYAIGDIALHPQANGEYLRIEHWNVAGNHGRVVGKSIASKTPQRFQKTPFFWSAQGQQLRYCGHASGLDEIYIEGNLNEMKFVAYYAQGKESKVTAVASMQRDPIASKAADLIALGKMPTLQEIRDGKNIMDIDMSTFGAKSIV